MATSTGAFLAGAGTTFVILAVGFGGGLMMANSVLNEPGSYQARAVAEAPPPVRVILPNSSEPAQPPQLQKSSLPDPAPQPGLQPAKEAQAPVEQHIEKADTRKAAAEERERQRRYAERKAKRQAEARARQQRELQQPHARENAPVVAFGDDEAPRSGSGFFGN